MEDLIGYDGDITMTPTMMMMVMMMIVILMMMMMMIVVMMVTVGQVRASYCLNSSILSVATTHCPHFTECC